MDIDKNSDPCSLPTMGNNNRPMTARKKTFEKIESWLFFCLRFILISH